MPLTEEEERAMSQRIKLGYSHLNDLPPDNKKFKKRSLMDQSIKFDNQTIRDGVELKKDGLIITSKGKEVDIIYISDDDPQRHLKEAEQGLQEAIRRRKAPDLQVDAAFKKIAKKGFVNIDIGKMKGRYSTGVLPNDHSMPACNNFSGQRFESGFMNEKSMQMNKFIEQSRDMHFEANWNTKTTS